MAHLPKRLRSRPGHWALGAALLCGSTSALAQEPAGLPALDRQVDEAFRQVLKTPASLDAGLKDARLLVAAGNYEGGVAALERLLLSPNPQPGIRVELAVLYYRLGSYEMAESLLRQALDDTRLEGEPRTLAQTLLRDVSARNQPSQLRGMLMIGVRRQSNPSARSDADRVFAAGTLTPLADAYKPKSDTDIQLTARLDHRYDLGWQNEASVVSSLVAQITDYQSSSGRTLRANQENPYDLAWGELTTGLRFKPAPIDLPGLRLRPYLILAELAAQGHRYLNNRGLGLEAEYQFNEKTLASANYEYRHYHYSNRVDLPAAEQLGGPDHNLRLQLSRELAPGHLLSAELGLRQHQTGRAYYDYQGEELRLTYSTSYPSPLTGVAGGYWSTAAWAGAAQRRYGAADPSITASQTRKDTDWRIGLSQSVPLTGNWSMLLQVEHVRTHSNLPNYQARNTSLMGALAYRF